MKLCRVIGNVVATDHHPAFDGFTLLLVQPESPEGDKVSSTYIAVDSVQAGPGDRVLVLSEGSGVAQVLKTPRGPIRSVIVGVVDEVEAHGAVIPSGG
jgi:ethanolamine utilization protein EutN